MRLKAFHIFVGFLKGVECVIVANSKIDVGWALKRYNKCTSLVRFKF